jgi:bacterioferritin-associated ferredoxin
MPDLARDKIMIVCSCNVFSDQQVRSTLAKATQQLRMSQIYHCLGSGVQCGRCAHTIKQIMSSKLRSGVSVMSSGGLVIDSRPPADLLIAASADRSIASALPETGGRK